MHARLAWPGCGRPSTPAWRRPVSGQPWPLVSRPSSSSWPPSRSRCWYPATARRAARARRPTRRRAIQQERRERRSRCRRPRRGRARPRCLQHPRRPLTRPRRLRLRIPPHLRRSPPRLRPVPRRAAHPDTQGVTAAEPGNLVQRPTAPNTQICAPQETSAKSQAAAPNGGSACVLPGFSITQRDAACRRSPMPTVGAVWRDWSVGRRGARYPSMLRARAAGRCRLDRA